SSRSWEERFGLEMYLPLIRTAAQRALEQAGIEQGDHVIVSSPHARAAKAAAKQFEGRVEAEPLPIGYAGAADVGVRLAAVLDRAAAGETILVISAADGCDALVLRTTAALEGRRAAEPVVVQAARGRELLYATYLTWRGMLDREPPRRPEPERPAGPPSARSEAWKFGFVGSKCDSCGQVHVPPRRVCAGCGAVDRMSRAPLAGRSGVAATYTVDRLAYSPSPPIIDAVVDFDGGGRYTLEVTDAGPADIDIGTQLELTFRRLYTVDGVHNYFWKVRPL
ncbi:MAG TPA: zinc ribbon domain-containing protein, partial [Solirubrobacterales bacterium]|nr:zinc ribbon domain-containing protein [Solirubrobacterales bacterium]